MSSIAKAGIGILVMLLIVGIATISSVVGIYNNCINQEAGLEAQYKQNQNNYDNMFKRVMETSGITERYADDFKNIYDGVMKNRYGSDGAKAVFQMITEQNPQLDASVYKQVQQVIESSRESFMKDQKALLDKKQIYEAFLDKIPSGPVARIMGFPRKDISKFDIVSSERTERAFDTKKDEPMDLGPKKK